MDTQWKDMRVVRTSEWTTMKKSQKQNLTGQSDVSLHVARARQPVAMICKKEHKKATKLKMYWKDAKWLEKNKR